MHTAHTYTQKTNVELNPLTLPSIRLSTASQLSIWLLAGELVTDERTPTFPSLAGTKADAPRASRSTEAAWESLTMMSF